MEKIVLHTCCAPCSSAIIEWLMADGIRPVIFFYNPNIYPLAEYERRKGECMRFAGSLGLEVIDGDWEHAGWLERVRGLEKEPERGERCAVCFRMRLEKAAELAARLGITRFATTLAASRWKSLEQIAQAGREAGALFPGTAFWEKNWRKGGLEERRRQLLKIYGFYNQTWCGCEFSN